MFLWRNHQKTPFSWAHLCLCIYKTLWWNPSLKVKWTNQKTLTYTTNQGHCRKTSRLTLRYIRAPWLYLVRSPTSCSSSLLDFLQQVQAAKAWAPKQPRSALSLDVYPIAGQFFCIHLPCIPVWFLLWSIQSQWRCVLWDVPLVLLWPFLFHYTLLCRSELRLDVLGRSRDLLFLLKQYACILKM